VSISCRDLNWLLVSLRRVFTLSLPLFTSEDLYIFDRLQTDWLDNIDTTLWLELLHRFTAVKDLYLSEKVAPRIVPALQEHVGDRTTEVFPILQNIFLEGSYVPEGIQQFVAARRLTVFQWNR
jgi:hypothetical protein